MKNLNFIMNQLAQHPGNLDQRFFIPETWNTVQFGECTRDNARPGEIQVDPYEYIQFCFAKYFLPGQAAKDDRSFQPNGSNGKDAKIELTRNIIYSMFPRMFTAWDHYQKGAICSGTFLKAICLLPYLKEMQVDIIYLLPIFEYSNKYQKGELGSPYAIKNIYKLDLNLHDPLLGDNATEMIEVEFKAFIDACHFLGIKVMVDFVFRTVSRDNDLICDHPEWFYWIDLKHNDTFAAPAVETEKSHTLLNDRTLKSLYHSKNIKQYLSCFTLPPSRLDPARWRKILAESRKGNNILDLVETEFKITTAPGFSDVLNDPQPPWTDVTYLKFYDDLDQKVRNYLDKDQPPYILHDGASLNLYHGNRANRELWEYVANIIPFYQQNYGIDGARIDMGHALPVELNREIVNRSRHNNPNFILWSEEFNTTKSKAARKDGFHFISGFTWGIYKELEKSNFNKSLLLDVVMKSALPITAALETPDTPRLAFAYRDKRNIEQLVIFNCFLPNAVVFINNGLEVMELQPMNLGLDNTEAGRFVLEKTDPLYGKLAFFDNYHIHWQNPDREWMRRLLIDTLNIRQSFVDLISDKRNFYYASKLKEISVICYCNRKSGQDLFILANRDFSVATKIQYSVLLPRRFKKIDRPVHIVYENGGSCNEQREINELKILAPGEVVIGWMQA
jgi:hypothetical protein